MKRENLPKMCMLKVPCGGFYHCRHSHPKVLFHSIGFLFPIHELMQRDLITNFYVLPARIGWNNYHQCHGGWTPSLCKKPWHNHSKTFVTLFAGVLDWTVTLTRLNSQLTQANAKPRLSERQAPQSRALVQTKGLHASWHWCACVQSDRIQQELLMRSPQ